MIHDQNHLDHIRRLKQKESSVFFVQLKTAYLTVLRFQRLSIYTTGDHQFYR